MDNVKDESQSGVNFEMIGEMARQYGERLGKNLDYSAQSVEELEEILQSEYEKAQGQNDTEQYLWSLSVTFGIYLGQTLLKNVLAQKGYCWALEDSNVPMLKKDGSNAMYPVNKVYKRLTEGSGDSVKFFYQVAIMMAEGKFPPRDNQK